MEDQPLRVIRNRQTGCYYSNSGNWSGDISAAKRFSTLIEAKDESQSLSLSNCDVILKLGEFEAIVIVE